MARFHPDDYKCTDCNLQFDRAHQFIEHMRQEHQVEINNISVPDADTINVPSHVMRYTKKVTAHRTLMKQKKLGISNDIDPTPLMEFDSLSFLEDSLKCSECHEEFESGRSLRIHMRNHSNGGGQVPLLPVDLERVRELKALEYVHECDICLKKFSAVFALNAHKKFKHGIFSSGGPPAAKKRKLDKPKFDVDCDICEFTSFRRDYVEHHVKAAHKPEFHCRHCSRTLSNFNLYIYHLHESHPKAKENLQRLHKCSDCHKCFRTIENMKSHREQKHAKGLVVPENHCVACGVTYATASGLEIHCQNHAHKGVQKFMDSQLEESGGWEDVGNLEEEIGDIKYEADESEALIYEKPEVIPQEMEEEEPEDSVNDPFQRMLEQKIQAIEKPIKLKPTTDDDKLDYLNYLQCVDGVYSCGICGKTKSVRKHMLHHLKVCSLFII